MGRRRLPALLALVAGLLLGAGAGAQGVVAYGLHGDAARSPAAVASGPGELRASGHDAFVLATTPRPTTTAVHRADRSGPAGRSLLRDAAFLLAVALLAIALAAFVGRQRRRSRPPTWYRAALLGRGPPLLLAA
jgi:hypothetical protein